MKKKRDYITQLSLLINGIETEDKKKINIGEKILFTIILIVFTIIVYNHY